MLFEIALKEELRTVEEQSYPLIAPESKKPPYIVYRKRKITYAKTLGGTTNKAEAMYDIYIVADSYDTLLSLSESVKNKLLSFLGRYIGTTTPVHVKNVTVEFEPDNYVSDFNWIQSQIKLSVNY
jgi:hypothetical protein